jgi:hypothetical protein
MDCALLGVLPSASVLQFRRKQKLAEQLKEQQRELAEKQKQREEHLKSLKSEVPIALYSSSSC